MKEKKKTKLCAGDGNAEAGDGGVGGRGDRGGSGCGGGAFEDHENEKIGIDEKRHTGNITWNLDRNNNENQDLIRYWLKGFRIVTT